jgi:hypothetical protein
MACIISLPKQYTQWINKMKIRTPEQRAALLVKAKILDKNGNYDARFFSKETVEKSKVNNSNVINVG